MRNAAFAIALLACLALAKPVVAKPAAIESDALARAVRADDVDAARAALDQHADPNQKLTFAATPLAWAVDAQNPSMVELLLARGASPNTQDTDGTTPLAIGCSLGDPTILEMLINAGAEVRAIDSAGVTTLAICAAHAPTEVVAKMLAGGAIDDAIDSRGQTPLMWAASSGKVDTIRLLLKAGADVNRASRAGFTPLFFAIKSGVLPATEAMLTAGAKADYRGPEGTSAAQLALYQNNYGAAAIFVERGASLTERDRNGYQLLQAAAAGGDVSLVRLLLAKGADPNALSGPSRLKYTTEANFGRPPAKVPPTPPLLLAAANGHADVMRVLIAAGANPKFRAEDGTNVVFAAVKSKDSHALEVALADGPDPNIVNVGGNTPLHQLITAGVVPTVEPAMLKLLAAYGARTDIKDAKGITVAKIVSEGSDELKSAFRAIFTPKTGPLLAIAATH